MTPHEFKAWFEGFTENIIGTPTDLQWRRVRERVAEINGQPVTEHHFFNNYWPPNYSSYRQYLFPNTIIGGGYSMASTANQASSLAGYAQAQTFDSANAFSILGTADAASLT